MTAEVAILNASAVALAADSAVTIGNRKIYNSAIKLFALSKHAPVGAMVFGNAELLGTPWETILKCYRQQLGTKSFDRLDAYLEDLVRFIEGDGRFLDAALATNWLRRRLKSYLEYIRDAARKRISTAFEAGKSLPLRAIVDAFKDILQAERSMYQNITQLSLNSGGSVFIERESHQAIRDFGPAIFGRLYHEVENDLLDLSPLLTLGEVFPDGDSGLVVAGFGNDEIYPSIVTIRIDGGVPGSLRRRRLNEKCGIISPHSNALIVPFAQDDMMTTFMEGVNPKVLSFVESAVFAALGSMPEALMEVLSFGKKRKAQLKTPLETASKNIASRLIADFQNHRYSEHVSPILDMVSALPKNELAEMAESLVNLTAFKRRVSHALETVGGPVDVCVISKGDGLVWVKRKLYFPADLNHAYFSNYHR